MIHRRNKNESFLYYTKKYYCSLPRGKCFSSTIVTVFLVQASTGLVNWIVKCIVQGGAKVIITLSEDALIFQT